MTQYQIAALLKLKCAAHDVSDKALIAFYTEQQFHKCNLDQYVEQLESAVAKYKEAMEND